MSTWLGKRLFSFSPPLDDPSKRQQHSGGQFRSASEPDAAPPLAALPYEGLGNGRAHQGGESHRQAGDAQTRAGGRDVGHEAIVDTPLNLYLELEPLGTVVRIRFGRTIPLAARHASFCLTLRVFQGTRSATATTDTSQGWL